MSNRLIVTVLGVLAAALVVGGAATGLRVLPGSTGAGAAAPATLSIVGAPASISPGDPSFQVEIRVQDVTDLALYDWQISYNPAVIELTDPPADAVADGGFLGSTGRTLKCPPPILPPTLAAGNVRFACLSTPSFGGPPGASGSGTLSTVSFRPVAGGSVSMGFVCGVLTDREEHDIPSNISPCVVPTPVPTATGAAATPTSTPTTPVSASPTATSAVPTATATPRPPTPTPEPAPPPEKTEDVGLYAGCNPVVSTYRDGTTVQTLTARVAPAGALSTMWKYVLGDWLAYAPAVPQASDLELANFLDVLFLCVDGPGTFVRMLV